jgi:AcrR family transcriptional regulator
MGSNRSEILRATIELLGTEGYAALTTERVAERAGLSHAGVHYHFETKTDLVEAAVEHVHENTLDGLRSIEGPPDERLAAMLSELFAVAAAPEGQTAALLSLNTAGARDERLREALAAFDREVTAFVAGVIADGIEVGVFTDRPPEATARTLLATADGAGIRGLLGEPTDGVREVVRDRILDDLYVEDAPTLEVDA